MQNGLRVLVAVDGSAASLEACRTLTQLLPANADVRLLTVLSFREYPHSLMGGSLSDEEKRADAAQRTAAEAQNDAREVFVQAGFDVTAVHRFGFAPNEIIAELNEHETDVLAVARRDGAKENGPDTALDRIIRRAQVPVLLVA
jgi:nucleotide-binding universal stress UspA family protein